MQEKEAQFLLLPFYEFLFLLSQRICKRCTLRDFANIISKCRLCVFRVVCVINTQTLNVCAENGAKHIKCIYCAIACGLGFFSTVMEREEERATR